MDVAELAPLDRALYELAVAERDGEPIMPVVPRVAWAWVRMDEREQAHPMRTCSSGIQIGIRTPWR